MIKGMGPHVPKDGWLKRWPMQALQLMPQSPMAILYLAVAIILVGLAVLFALSISPSKSFFLTILSASAPLSCILICMSLNRIVLDDGHLQQSNSDVVKNGLKIGIPVGMITFAGWFLMMFILPGSGAESNAQDQAQTSVATHANVMKSILWVGQYSIQMVLFSCTLINTLWIAATPARTMSLTEALRSSDIMTKTMWRANTFLWVFQIAVLIISSLLPAPFGQLVFIYSIFVYYVAAREVFGGIDENGEPAKQLAPAAGGI